MEPYPLLLYLLLLLFAITFVVDLTLRSGVEGTLPPRILTFLYLAILVPMWTYYDVYWEGVDDIIGWFSLPGFLFAFLWSLSKGHLIPGWFGLFDEDEDEDEDQNDEVWDDDEIEDDDDWVEEPWPWEEFAEAGAKLSRWKIWLVILWAMVLSTFLWTMLFYYVNWWLLGVVDPYLKGMVSGDLLKLLILLMLILYRSASSF